MEIDIDLLYAQRNELLKIVWDDKDNILWGVVHLLDDMLDRYEKEKEKE